MQLKVLNANDVTKALPMADAIQAMRTAFAGLAAGNVTMPLRTIIDIPKQDAMAFFMPAYNAIDNQLGVKIVSAFPNNTKMHLPSIHGVVFILNPNTGIPEALLEGATLTAIRTGAVCGLATDLLANKNATSVAIIGSGVQARTQLEAVCCVRNIKQAWVYSPNQQNSEKFITDMKEKANIPSSMQAVASVQEATRNADILCTATPATSPIIYLSDIKPGVHINAVGSHSAKMCEIDPQLVAKTKIIVDQRQAALAEAGDIIQTLRVGLITEKDFIELSEIVFQPKLGRNSTEQITFFKSVGLAIQDVSAAQQALTSAVKNNLGTFIQL